MTEKTFNSVRLSKFLSRILRHEAFEVGLQPDLEGFVPLSEMLALVQKRFGPNVGRAEIEQLIATQQPRRFEFRGDGIRATYGHSFNAPVTYPPVEPPPLLYHGTHPGALESIRREGLRSMKRQYVHLSTSVERATQVASRHTRAPVILKIRAHDAYEAGIVFHSPESQHYLATSIPPEFIEW